METSVRQLKKFNNFCVHSCRVHKWFQPVWSYMRTVTKTFSTTESSKDDQIFLLEGNINTCFVHRLTFLVMGYLFLSRIHFKTAYRRFRLWSVVSCHFSGRRACPNAPVNFLIFRQEFHSIVINGDADVIPFKLCTLVQNNNKIIQ